MKDYYKILGVEEEASEEEIRARWIELTKYYHPDLGKTEEGDEKIREINEAYEVLQNEATRYRYDFERDLKRSFIKKALRRQERRMNIRKLIILPSSGILVLCVVVGFFLFRRADVAAPPGAGAKTEAAYKIDQGSEKKTALQTPLGKTDSKSPEETGVPREIKKEVVSPENKKGISLSPGLSQPAAQQESAQKKEPPRKILQESKVPISAPLLTLAEKESEGRKEPAPQVALKLEMPAVKEVSKEVPKEIPKEVPKESPKEIPKEVAKEELPIEVPKEVSKEVSKEIPKEIPKEAPKEVPDEVLKAVPKEVPKEIAKQIPKEVAKELPKEAPKEKIKVTLHPGEKLTMQTKEEKTVPIRSPVLAKEEEVKEFFSDYVDRYHRKDVAGFLSLFSTKAIQNQTDGFEAIRSIYSKFINQSEEIRYQIEGIRIEIYQNKVEVKARFRVDQKLKKDGEEKVWKGNIRWVLVKEEGDLKIISLDYQNEKPS